MSRKKMLLLISVVLIPIIIGSGIIYAYLSRINYRQIDKSDSALGITPVIIERVEKDAVTPSTINIKKKNNGMEIKKSNIVNIALFGVDRRSENVPARSDSTIVLTIDYAKHKLKFTSIMRDLYVHVDGHGFTKLTHAYAYGGPALAIKTLNQNFGLDIRDYITVDFDSMASIIDKLGGVSINVKPEEIANLNNSIVSTKDGKNEHITKSGYQLLDGTQAVGYSRIRYVGHGDFDRTERQRTVLITLLSKVKSKGIKEITGLILDLLPYVETSMGRLQIVSLGSDFTQLRSFKVDEERFPIDGYYKSDMSTGVYYLKTNLKVCKNQVTDYIYNDIRPEVISK